jgi:uncharacterized protein with PQ loop repeat
MEKQKFSFFLSFDFIWLSFALMTVLLLAFFLPVLPNDYWWYMRIGQEVLATGQVPAVDIISASGQPIMYHSWLSAVIFSLLYDAGGLGLTIFARGLVIGLAYLVLWALVRRAGVGPKLAWLLMFMAVLASSNNWVVRPQMFTYFLFALSLWILYQWQNGDNRFLWVLPLISLLWVNLHGSFVLLFPLIGAALIFGAGQRKFLLLAFVLAFLAILVNPRGVGVFEYIIFSITSESNQLSMEWGPPVNDNWQMNIFFVWLLAFIPLAAFSPKKLNRLEWVWFLGFGLLALFGLRYVIWFIFLLVVISATLLSGWTKASGAQRFTPLNLALGLVLLAMPILLLPGLRERWMESPPPVTANTPFAVVEWLEAHPEVPNPLWNQYVYGSYLAYALPGRPVWIHTMFEAYSREHWERYLAVSAARYDWQKLLDEDGVNSMLLSVQSQDNLLSALRQSETWCEVYKDDDAAIFIRIDPGEPCPGLDA